MKYIVALLSVIIFYTAASAQSPPKYPKTNPYPKVIIASDYMAGVDKEDIPYFPSGNDSLTSFLNKNIKYPASMRNKKNADTVLVGFTIDKNGNISDITTSKKITGLSNEIIRVFKLLPKWMPARQVPSVRIFLPLVFEFGE